MSINIFALFFDVIQLFAHYLPIFLLIAVVALVAEVHQERRMKKRMARDYGITLPHSK